MNNSNLQCNFANDQKLSFSPVLSKVNNMGTTVTYGIQAMNSVNAVNAGGLASGNYVTAPVAFNQWPATNSGFTNVSSGYYPSINAGYNSPYSNLSSGYYGFYQAPYNQTLVAQPSVDISETTSDVCVAAYIPNVALNDVSLSVTDNSVTISATAWTGVQNVVFNRTIALPTSIHTDSVDASMQSGILEIRLPKADKVSRKRNTFSQDVVSTTTVPATTT